MIKRSINLVKAAKKPIKVKKQLDKIYLFINFFIAIIIATIIIIAIILNSIITSNNKKILDLEMKINKAEQMIIGQAEYKKTYNFLKKYNEDMAYVLEIIKLTPSLSEGVFASIEDCKIESIELSDFQIDSNTIKIIASSMSEMDIMEYVERLRQSEYFSVVDWQNSIISDGNIYRCSLSLSIANHK